RECLANALVNVGQFFTTLAGRLIGDRFFELGSALADLNIGTVSPLLAPVSIGNRPADPSQLWRARARAALALEAFIRAGLSHDDATAEIRRAFPRIRELAGARAKRSGLSAILSRWRKEFRARRIKNFEATELFSAGLERINGLASVTAHRRFGQ